MKWAKVVNKACVYARVSSHDQKADLERQKLRLEKYCEDIGIPYETISDLGYGLNYKKKGLKKLINMICKQEISELILTHRGRLL